MDKSKIPGISILDFSNQTSLAATNFIVFFLRKQKTEFLKPIKFLSMLVAGIMLGISVGAQAQEPSLMWAKELGGAQADVATSSIVDHYGNIYTIGYFSGTVNFNPGSRVPDLVAEGYSDAFITKFSSSGNVAWAKRIGDPSSSTRSHSIAIDQAGNLYVSGTFTNSVDIDPGSGEKRLFGFGQNVFFLKLNSSGNFIWGNGILGEGDERLTSFTVDPAGNSFIAGTFGGRNGRVVDIDPGPAVYNLTSTDDNEGISSVDAFILKLDTQGNFAWARQLVGMYTEEIASIKVDGAGFIYTGGNFSRTVDFDPGNGVYEITAQQIGPEDQETDGFVSKLTSNGEFIWARRLGGLQYDYVNSISIDNEGNSYATGSFEGTANFGTAANATSLVSSGDNDVFIQKLNNSGDLVWVKGFGGNSIDNGNSVFIDRSGFVYATGYFSGTVDFNPAAVAVQNIGSSGGQDVFVTKLDVDGNYVWAKKIGGAATDIGNSILLDGSRNIIISGASSATADFDPATGVLDLTSKGATDVFITKWKNDPLICDAPTTTSEPRCGNGAVVLQAAGGVNGNYRWYDSYGATSPIAGAVNDVFTTPSLSSTKTYYVSLINGECESERKSVKAIVNPAVPVPQVKDVSRCGRGSVKLIATGGSAGDYRWYTQAEGGTPIRAATSGVFTTPELEESTIYYVSINNGFCESPRSVITAIINAPFTIEEEDYDDVVSCGPGRVELRATGASNGNYRWYTSLTDPNPINGETASTYTTPYLTETKTFYVSIVKGSCESNRVSIKVIVLPAPGLPLAKDTTICGPRKARLTVSGGKDGDYRWYTQAVGGDPIKGITSHKYYTFLLTKTTTFYISLVNGVCESKRVPLKVTVTPCEEVNLAGKFNIYPNPGVNVVNINVKQGVWKDNIKVIFWNSVWSKRKEAELNKYDTTFKNSVDISDLDDGLYIVEITDGERRLFKNLLIIK